MACTGNGRGSGSGANNNILQFPQKRNGGWDAPGNTKRLDDLETALKNARSEKTVSRVYAELKSFDRSITAQINNPGKYDDVTALQAQRRRGRQLMRRIERMGYK